MAQLPQPGVDYDWGNKLNKYLLQAHDTHGNLRPHSVGEAQVEDGSLTPKKFASGPLSFDSPLLAPNLPKKITVSKEPPANPQDGEIWFKPMDVSAN